LFRTFTALLVAAAAAVMPSGARASRGRAAEPLLGLFGPRPELDELSWLSAGLHQHRPLRWVPDRSLPLLAHYLAPAQNHVADWRSFFRGEYGLASWSSRFALRWSLGSQAPEPEALSVSSRACPAWRAPRPVRVARFNGELSTLPLIDCDGGVAPDAIDVLSVLARAPGSPRPELPLPFEPSADAGPGEWLPSVKLLDPRLIWVMEQLAEAFPRRTLYIMSGYRQNGHSGFHGKGKAIDLFVQDVPNEQVFEVCRRLHDVGCGYYPNNRFVHVDVRPYGTDRVLWVDDSLPGTPSHYLDGFEGVLEPGRAWLPR
jgi:hypothetical protein